nr:MAG TPA: hypothetical protein [Caudoviricetes sp.]
MLVKTKNAPYAGIYLVTPAGPAILSYIPRELAVLWSMRDSNPRPNND